MLACAFHLGMETRGTDDVCVRLGPDPDERNVDRLTGAAQRFAITIYSSRSEAHDWLAGRSGAWRAAMRCLQKLVERGATVDVEIVMTRPALPHLLELAAVLIRVRPSRVVFRLPDPAGVAADKRVMLLPRMPFVIQAVEAAARRLESRRIACVAENIPGCAGDIHVTTRLRDGDGPASEMLRCETCDHARCAGVQREYVETFGWTDFERRAPRADVVVVPLHARSPLQCDRCHDPFQQETSSRAFRMHLTRAAATGAATLRITGSGAFWHPDAPALLSDAARLSFRRIEVAGEASGIARFTDSQLARLSGIASIEFPLYGPTAASHDTHAGIAGAWERTHAALERLRAFSGAVARPFAVLHDVESLPEQSQTWREVLGDAPRFRLTDPIDSAALVRCISGIDDAAIRSAIAAHLPPCCHPAPADRTESEVHFDGRFRSVSPRSPADPGPHFVRCNRCSGSEFAAVSF